MNILVTVCARGGSKGIKKKNIHLLSGKPLLAYTVEVAKKWGRAKRIVCSTDSTEIAAVAKKYGAEVPFLRPGKLASDSSGKLPAIRHALKECERLYREEYDLVVDLDVTSPLRTVRDLDNCLSLFKKKKPEILFSVVESKKNPYFNMVEEKSDGFVTLSKKSDRPVLRRQDVPKVFSMNASIYFYARDFLLDEHTVSVTSSDRAVAYVMPEAAALDIDSEQDFRFIEFLIAQGKVRL